MAKIPKSFQSGKTRDLSPFGFNSLLVRHGTCIASSVREAMELEGQPAKIRHLERLHDDELLQLIDFHGGYFIQWFETHENPRLSLIYHGQILWALLDECDRRGKSVTQLGAEFKQRLAILRAWEQTPGNA